MGLRNSVTVFLDEWGKIPARVYMSFYTISVSGWIVSTHVYITPIQ